MVNNGKTLKSKPSEISIKEEKHPFFVQFPLEFKNNNHLKAFLTVFRNSGKRIICNV